MKIVVWCGYGGNRYLAEDKYFIIKALGAKLRIISEWEPNIKFPDIEYITWELDTWRKFISECYVAIAPQNTVLQPCKSNIKVTTYMSCGVPVVASPLQSYKEIIINDYNGYLASDDYQWTDCINILLNCTQFFRQNIIDNAFHSIESYSSCEITARWQKVIQGIV